MIQASPFLHRINQALSWAHQSGMPIPSLDLAAIEAVGQRRAHLAAVIGAELRIAHAVADAHAIADADGDGNREPDRDG